MFRRERQYKIVIINFNKDLLFQVRVLVYYSAKLWFLVSLGNINLITEHMLWVQQISVLIPSPLQRVKKPGTLESYWNKLLMLPLFTVISVLEFRTQLFITSHPRIVLAKAKNDYGAIKLLLMTSDIRRETILKIFLHKKLIVQLLLCSILELPLLSP